MEGPTFKGLVSGGVRGGTLLLGEADVLMAHEVVRHVSEVGHALVCGDRQEPTGGLFSAVPSGPADFRPLGCQHSQRNVVVQRLQKESAGARRLLVIARNRLFPRLLLQRLAVFE